MKSAARTNDDEAKRFMEKYGNMPRHALPRVASILEHRARLTEAVAVSLDAIRNRMNPRPPATEAVGQTITRAAGNGDQEAVWLIKNGLLSIIVSCAD